MSFRYISTDELIKTIDSTRITIVVKNIPTKDKEEFHNSCLATLTNEGFNINLLTQPKLNKTLDNRTHLVYTIRKGTPQTEINENALNIWSIKMGNVVLHNIKRWIITEELRKQILNKDEQVYIHS